MTTSTSDSNPTTPPLIPPPSTSQAFASSGMFSGAKVNITKNSFMNLAPTYKFRIGVGENAVTNFSPNSSAFAASIRQSLLLLKEGFGEGQIFSSISPHISIGTEKCLKGIGSDLSYSELVIDLSKNNTEGLTFPTTGPVVNKHLIIKKSVFGDKKGVDFKDLVTILRRAWLSSEELIPCSDDIILFTRYLPATDTTGKNKIFRRLINVYEPIPGELFCFSFITYSGLSPDKYILANYWLNKHEFDSSEHVQDFIPIYIQGGIPFILANIVWRQFGIQIHPLGYATLLTNFQNEVRQIQLPSSFLSRLGVNGLGSFNIRNSGGNTNRCFRFDKLKIVDLNWFNLKRGPGTYDSISYINSQISNSGPGVIKLISDGIIRNNYQKFGYDKQIALKEFKLTLEDFERDFDISIIKQYKQDLQMKTLLRDRFSSQEKIAEFKMSLSKGPLPINYFAYPQFRDKLVFDN